MSPSTGLHGRQRSRSFLLLTSMPYISLARQNVGYRTHEPPSSNGKSNPLLPNTNNRTAACRVKTTANPFPRATTIPSHRTAHRPVTKGLTCSAKATDSMHSVVTIKRSDFRNTSDDPRNQAMTAATRTMTTKTPMNRLCDTFALMLHGMVQLLSFLSNLFQLLSNESGDLYNWPSELFFFLFFRSTSQQTHIVNISLCFLDMIKNVVRPLLEEIFYLGSRSPVLAHKKVASLLHQYETSDKPDRIAILEHIAKAYHPDEHDVLAQVCSPLDAARLNRSISNTRRKRGPRRISSNNAHAFTLVQNPSMPSYFV